MFCEFSSHSSDLAFPQVTFFELNMSIESVATWNGMAHLTHNII